MINSTTGGGTDCSLQMPVVSPNILPGSFFFRATTATNEIDPRYQINQPVALPAGATQNFLFGFTPSGAFQANEIPIVFRCVNVASVTSYNGVNTFILSAPLTLGADVVAIGATPSNDGIVTVAGTGASSFFAASAINIGAASAITASVDDGGRGLALTTTICETNPSTGVCLTPPGASTTRTLTTNAIATYTVFVRRTGSVPFDPANNRLFLRFRDGANVVVGATNVAVRTTGP